MTQYSDGRKLEYAAAADLRANGYVVMRTAGSHGPADLIAIKPGELLFVQCKLDGYLTPDERAKLQTLALMVDAVAVVARWVKDGRAARQVGYWHARPAPGYAQQAWTPDHALEAS